MGTRIRSFRATKINKNRGLIFKDNYCQLRRQFVSIQRLTFVFAPNEMQQAAFEGAKQNEKVKDNLDN